MSTLLLKPCTICRQEEQLPSATRCAGCQKVFNALRERDKALGGKDGRTAPSANRLRAAVLGGSWIATPATQTRKAGHNGKRSRASVPEEVREAQEVISRWRSEQRKGKQGYVYCIAEAEGLYPLVKIGYSDDPPARVPELQTGNGRKLFLLAYFAGTESDEKALHARYIKDNTLQEWFRPSDELLSEFGYDTYDLYKKGSAAR